MFQKSEFASFRKDFSEAVKGLEKKYGVTLELHNISYSDVEFHTKLTATKIGENKEKQVNIDDFNWLKQFLGFKGNIGDNYTDRKGVTYTVYNLDGKKPKFPVLLRGSDGKTYKAPVDVVNMQLSKKGI
jgi:hypothetical protein